MFFPYKLDVDFHKTPWLTILLIGFCIGIHAHLQNIDKQEMKKATLFCVENSQFFKNILKIKQKSFDLIPWVDKSDCPSSLVLLSSQPSFLDDLDEYDEIQRKTKEDLIDNYEVYLDEVGSRGTFTYADYIKDISIVRMFTSSFVHADWGHVLSNMYYLWLYGAILELVIGKLYYILFIFGGSIFTSLMFHLYSNAFGDEFLFSVGASGFIFAIMGAFLTLFFRVEVKTFFLFFIKPYFFNIPSWVLLVLYFISEIWTLVTGTYGSTNVISHLSGFIFGAGLGLTLLKKYKY